MDRVEIINFLIKQRNYKRFLEIGLQNDRYSFAYVHCSYKRKVELSTDGLTPAYADFFKQNETKFDIILIDGIHSEEQVLLDLRMAGQCLAEGGVIVLHDCMPPDAWHQRSLEEYREGESWNGTVWKAALRMFNSSKAKCFLLDTDWGCGIIDTAQSQMPARVPLPQDLEYETHYPLLLKYKRNVADFLRAHVRVFYHLACMGNWQEVFQEQMTNLKQGGFSEFSLSLLGTVEDWKYVQTTCAGLKIEAQLVFQDTDLRHFEKPAMLAIQEYARREDGYVLYLHSKGVSNPTDSTKVKWRRLMMRELVDNWERCALQLPRYDLIGVNWRDLSPVAHFCGNFWYASTHYLRTLADFEYYYDNPRYRIWDDIESKRLGCEFWIGSAPQKPNLLSLAYRNIDFCNPVFWRNK